VSWKVKEHIEDIALFSKNDMQRMKANAGDLVYLCDARKIFGGLKSVHTVFGEPHEEDGVVYISNEDLLNAQFVKGKPITAEKEM
jgi:SSS family solute:Na+ symporter